MNRRTQNRSVAAVTLLMLMAINFGTEGFALYLAYNKIVIPSAKAISACTPPGQNQSKAESVATSSCCSTKKKPTSCGCPCCGDSCPMGDACTCTNEGKPATGADGLFFRTPGCHPAQSDYSGKYLPLSVRLIYLPPALPVITNNPVLTGSIIDRPVQLAGALPAPPVPPPKHLAA